MDVTVLTPSIGKDTVLDAIESVSNQNYKEGKVKHLVVNDGPPRKVWRLYRENLKWITLPENTGKAGGDFYGHRIYAAFPHLINTDYICFLDEDNWYGESHISTLMMKMKQNPELDFVYSLRSIYDEQKNFLCLDDCESLGKWPIYGNSINPQYLIDTSSFLFRKDFLVKTCHLWHFGWGGDRRFLELVKRLVSPKFECSGRYTLHYRLAGNSNSVNLNFFEKGNEITKNLYNGNYPWSAV